jgi:hypothetical protein
MAREQSIAMQLRKNCPLTYAEFSHLISAVLRPIGSALKSCKELRRVRRELRFRRVIPGLVAMSGLFAASIPVIYEPYDLDQEWREELARTTAPTA